MSNNIQIAIAGGNGKMGTLLSELIESKDCFEISGIYDPRNKSDKYITWENYSDIEGDYLFVFVPANYLGGFVKNYTQYIDKVKKMGVWDEEQIETVNELLGHILEGVSNYDLV